MIASNHPDPANSSEELSGILIDSLRIKMTGIIFISLFFMVIGMMVQFTLKNKFHKYRAVLTGSRLNGKEIAEKMLADNGIYDVEVTSVNGFLSDHYDPTKKTVNLSPDVFSGRNIAAAAVAAHECGHALQHAT